MAKKERSSDEWEALGELGERIGQVRLYYERSQTEFANLLGVSRSHLSEVEAQKAKPSVEMLVGITRAFPKVLPEWLLTGVGAMTNPGRGEVRDVAAVADVSARASRETIRIIDQLRKYSQEGVLSDDEKADLNSVLPRIFIRAYFYAARRSGITHNAALREAQRMMRRAAEAIARFPRIHL